MNKRFTIRVYGICIQNDMLLVNEEHIRGLAHTVIKLPGGGMNVGEGTTDCLKREWKEELGLEIAIAGHFYTTDFYQSSAFDDSQIISIYYRVTAQVPDVIVNNIAGERSYWVPMPMVSPDTFTLPIDKVVGGMLAAAHKSGG